MSKPKSEADSLMELAMGSIMTQVALCRFLVRENVISRERLLAYLNERGKSWGKTASEEALLALVTLTTALASDEEPRFPSTMH